MESKIVKSIKKELKANVDPVYRQGSRRYFKEEINNYGVRSVKVGKISNKYFSQIKFLSKNEILTLCEELLKSTLMEEAMIAFSWSFKIKEKLD